MAKIWFMDSQIRFCCKLIFSCRSVLVGVHAFSDTVWYMEAQQWSAEKKTVEIKLKLKLSKQCTINWPRIGFASSLFLLMTLRVGNRIPEHYLVTVYILHKFKQLCTVFNGKKLENLEVSCCTWQNNIQTAHWKIPCIKIVE